MTTATTRSEPARRTTAVTSLLVAAVVGVLVGRFLLAGSGDASSSDPGPYPGEPTSSGTASFAAPSGAASAAEVSALEARVDATPDDPRLLTRLGIAYLARARSTADPSFYARAEEALARSHALDDGSPETMVGLGLLDLGRHDFTAALDWAHQARRIAPGSADPLGVAYDALVELGRYDEAEEVIQAMADRRPSLPALVRVSQLRELHGDRTGAIEAATQAVAAGSRSAIDLAFAETVLGDLNLGGAELDRAAAAYERALRHDDTYARALVGQARVSAFRDDLPGAITILEPVIERTPHPAWVSLLGDLYAAVGRDVDAANQYDLVRAIEDLNRSNGVAVDLELARFEADQVGPELAADEADRLISLAREARGARPTIYGDDTLAWALRQAGRPEEALPYAQAAVRLGTQDSLLWYHLAAVETDLGLVDEARDHLARALAVNPHLTVRDRPAAVTLAAALNL